MKLLRSSVIFAAIVEGAARIRYVFDPMFILTLHREYDENKNVNYIFLSIYRFSDDNDIDKMLTIEQWKVVDCILLEFDSR